jgi:hypothetical protein
MIIEHGSGAHQNDVVHVNSLYGNSARTSHHKG